MAGSKVPEDPRHAENTLEWLLRLAPDTDDSLRIAALGHDIERAVEARKVRRSDFPDYDSFKAAHAHNCSKILREIMSECRVPRSIADEVCRLVRRHEVGGDPRADLLKDADSISFFDVNLPLYDKRNSREETLRRCAWGYQRLSKKMQEVARNISYDNPKLNALLKEVIDEKATLHS